METRSRCCLRSAVARLALTAPIDVRLFDGGMSIGEALAAFNSANREAGATASFLGKVRGGDGIKALELTHYEPLTLPGMEDLAGTAIRRFDLEGALVWHRIGVMTPGEPIVLVATAAAHRRAAFDAVDFLMDHLKSASWFWKREKSSDGWRWIEPRPEDHAGLARWK